MAIEKGRSDFDENSLEIDGKNNTNTGTSIYELGGGALSVTTNFDDTEIRNFSQYSGDFLDPITMEDIDDVNDVIVTVSSNDRPMDLSYDRSDLSKHSYFGSLKDKIDFSIINIISKFPASLYVNVLYNESVILTYTNRVYDSVNKKTSFKIPISAITNNYNLIITQNDNDTSLKNVLFNFNKYEISVNDETFNIIKMNNIGQYLDVEVNGEVFENTNGNDTYHIKPLKKYYNEFYLNLSDLEKYLLNDKSTPKYTAKFKDIEYDANGESVLIEKEYTWTTSDGYNLDYDNRDFVSYTESLGELCQKHDDFKSNIILRELVSDGVLNVDENDELKKVFKIIGNSFDEIKQFIDSLAIINHLSYDKNDTAPDKLVKNLAKTLGWGVLSTYDGKNLINDLVNGDKIEYIEGVTNDLTPVETDIELWRRIAINSGYLFKSKGTKNAIEFIFTLIGAPKSLIDIREYVYVANNKVTYNGDSNEPIDKDGYPLPLNTSDVYFQSKGGWNVKKDISPSNTANNNVVGIHKGDYNNGSTYIKSFQKAGFNLTRVENNIKVHVTNLDNSVMDDVIDVNDSRLVINSKEFGTFLTPVKYFEENILNWYNLKYNKRYATIGEVISNEIKVSTRKVVNYKDGYPSLNKIIYLYFKENTTIDIKAINEYINQLKGFWKDLIEQMIPSTAIWQGGTVYRNNVLNSQKHTYKHGINYGSEFESENKNFKSDKLVGAEIKSTVNLPMEGMITLIKNSAEHISTLTFPSLFTNKKESSNILNIKNNLSSYKKNITNIPTFEVKNVSRLSSNSLLEDYSTIVDSGGGLKEIILTFDDTITSNEYNFFHYSIFKFNSFTNEFDSTPVINGELSKSTIDNTTTVSNKKSITISHNFTDGDYLLKCGFSVDFSFSTPSDDSLIEYYKKITLDGNDNLINYVNTVNGIDIFNFDTLILQETGIYGIYDGNDYYFSVVEKPSSIIVEDFTSSTTREIAEMVTTRLTVHASGQRTFVLEDAILGDTILSINGLTLLKSSYRDLRDGGEYFIFYDNNNIQIMLSESIVVDINDIITITYIKSNSNITINNSGILQLPNLLDVTNDSVKNPRFGEANMKCYEYNFDYSLLTEVNIQSLIVLYNGVKLLPNNGLNSDYDFTVSPVNERSILFFIFDGLIYNLDDENDNDEIIIYYTQPLDDGFYIQNGVMTLSWKVGNTYDDGNFVIEVSDDVNFTPNSGRYWRKDVPYKNSSDGVIEYTQFLGNLDPVLDVNKTFFYRVSNNKKNVDLIGNEILVSSVFYTRTFKTDSTIQL